MLKLHARGLFALTAVMISIGTPRSAFATDVGPQFAAPSTYAGTLPCKQCSIHETYTFSADGSVTLRIEFPTHQRLTHVVNNGRTGHGTTFVVEHLNHPRFRLIVGHGKWTLDPDNETLTLLFEKDPGPRYLRVTGPRTIRELGDFGDPLPTLGFLDYTLTKQANPTTSVRSRRPVVNLHR